MAASGLTTRLSPLCVAKQGKVRIWVDETHRVATGQWATRWVSHRAQGSNIRSAAGGAWQASRKPAVLVLLRIQLYLTVPFQASPSCSWPGLCTHGPTGLLLFPYCRRIRARCFSHAFFVRRQRRLAPYDPQQPLRREYFHRSRDIARIILFTVRAEYPSGVPWTCRISRLQRQMAFAAMSA